MTEPTENRRLAWAALLAGPSLMLLGGAITLAQNIGSVIAEVQGTAIAIASTAAADPAKFVFVCGLGVTILTIGVVVQVTAEEGRHA